MTTLAKEPRGHGLLYHARHSSRAAGAVAVAALVLLVFAPAALVSAVAAYVVLHRQPDRMAAVVIAAPSVLVTAAAVMIGTVIGGSAGFYFGAWAGVAVDGIGHGRWSAVPVLVVIAVGLVAGPALGAAFWAVDQWYRERALIGGAGSRRDRVDTEAARRRKKLRRGQRQRYTEGKTRAGIGLGDERGPYVGIKQSGDLRWGRVGGTLRMPIAEAQRLVVLGNSGGGKSELVHNIIEWTMEHDPERQVIYLNAKEAAAGMEPSRRLIAHAEALSQARPHPAFPYAARMLQPGYAPYDGFRGTDQQLRDRLLSTEQFSEPHHRAGTVFMLQLALSIMRAGGRPATDLPGLLQMLCDRTRVMQLAASNPLAVGILESIDTRSWDGTVQRYAAAAVQLATHAGPREVGGWAWEDAYVSCVDLPTSSQSQVAQMLLRWMLADVIAYVTDPQRRPRRPDGSWVPLTLVLEELSALDTDPLIGRNVVNLTERGRSADVRFVVVGQGPSSLGDERTMNSLLSNSTVITGRQPFEGEPFVRLAGTATQLRGAERYDGRWTGVEDQGHAREERVPRLTPEDLQDLEVGEMVVIHAGRVARVSVPLHQGALAPETRPLPRWVDDPGSAVVPHQGPAAPPARQIDTLE